MIIKKIFKTIGKVILWFFVLTIAWVLLLRFVPVYVTPFMLRTSVESGMNGHSMAWSHTWKPIEEISPSLARAVIASEDNRFGTHYGFEFKSIQKSYESNKKGKRLRGGSTISQQTAKNVFTFGTRTWVRKGFETYFTLLIETLWPKKRIMEVYLNSIEMGRGVFGAEAAANAYFGTSAAKISASQAALVAAVLPNPKRYKIAAPSPYVQRRQSQILYLMPKMAPLDFLKAKKETPPKKQKAKKKTQKK